MKKSIFIIVLLVLILAGAITLFDRSKINITDQSQTNSTTTGQVSDPNAVNNRHLVQFTDDVITAASDYYLPETDRQISTNNKSAQDIFTNLDEQMLNDNNYMEEGNVSIQSYTDDSDPNISFVAKLLIEAATTTEGINNSLINWITTGNLTNIQMDSYQMAQRNSNLSKTDLQIMGIISYLPSLVLIDASSTASSTGLILWKISADERQTLIEKIESTYGNAIADDQVSGKGTGTYNSVLIGVDFLKNELICNTYECINTVLHSNPYSSQ